MATHMGMTEALFNRANLRQTTREVNSIFVFAIWRALAVCAAADVLLTKSKASKPTPAA